MDTHHTSQLHALVATLQRPIVGLSLTALALYLAVAHRQHASQMLLIAFLLFCPLMHLFMHGAHGGHTSQDADR